MICVTNRKVKSKLKDNLVKGEYKPYNMKPAPLKSKITNSVLLACILTNVKDKRIVEHRMRVKSIESDRKYGVKNKIFNIMNRAVDNITERNNISSEL